MAIPMFMVFFVLTWSCFAQMEIDNLADATNSFAVDMYHQVTHVSGNDMNVFFSPLSVQVLLGMMYEGSDSETRKQIGKATHLNTVKQLEASFRNLNSVLQTPNENYTLETANRLYVSDRYHFLKSYKDTMNDVFRADAVLSDFSGDSDYARKNINEWVKHKTKGRITDLIPDKGVDSSTIMVLVNALFFKGVWNSKFSHKETSVQPFFTPQNNNVKIDMMYQIGYFKSLVQKSHTALELPYKGSDVSMYVLLPIRSKDGLAKLESLLAYDYIKSITALIRHREAGKVFLTLPKFEINNRRKLKEILSQMGVDDLFSKETCDLSGVGGTRDLYVTEVFHQADISVDEDGSEAAAATGSGANTAVFIPPVEFKADHPFVFFIYDNVFDTILFMGRFTGPEYN